MNTCFIISDAYQNADESQTLAEGEKKLSDQLLIVLEHFKQPDPVGLPGADIPDPYKVPDMKHSFLFTTMDFKGMSVHGIRKFRIVHIDVEIAAMEVSNYDFTCLCLYLLITFLLGYPSRIAKTDPF